MSKYSDLQVREYLEGKVPLENFFLIGPQDGSGGVIAVWYPEIGIRNLIIRDNELACACKRLLREVGARRFGSWQELQEAQNNERLPGWDTCADAIRYKQSHELLRAMAARPKGADASAAIRKTIHSCSPLAPLASCAEHRQGFTNTDGNFGVAYPSKGSFIPNYCVRVYGLWVPPHEYQFLVLETFYQQKLVEELDAAGLIAEANRVRALLRAEPNQ